MTEVNVPTESKKQNKFEKNTFVLLASGNHWRKELDPDPDPYQSATDSEPWFFDTATGKLKCFYSWLLSETN